MNLHDELGRHGADAAGASAQRLSSVEVRQSLGERVRRGRRRRTVGGAGAVAGVALAAVGVWSVLPGDQGPVEPAVTPDFVGTTYEVDGSAPMSDEVPIDLRLPADLVCGAPLALSDGVTVHDSSAIDAGFSLTTTTELLLDDGSRTSDPTSVWAGYEAHAFRYFASASDLTGAQWFTMPLLLRDGELVGLGTASGGGGDGSTSMAGSEEAWTPEPGSCVNGGEVDGLGDGVYEPVLVTQLWSQSQSELLATIVVSAGDVEYTGMGETSPDTGEVIGLDELPAFGTDEYFASATDFTTVREWSGGLSCSVILDGLGEGGDQGAVVEDPGAVPPVPSWLETGRLYGWGDDALVGGYPTPIVSAEEEWATTLGDQLPTETDGPARLVLSAAGDYWVFDVRWFERDDLPHDEPGWFIELAQDWECGNPDLIDEGVFAAHLLYGTEDGQFAAELAHIQVVSGVPSLPEIDAQG